MAQDHQNTEDPEALASQIRGLTREFKKSLASSVPWDADVESQRKRIRGKTIHLLFAFPFASQSRSLDASLWLDTTHAMIALYRQQMAALGTVPANKGSPAPRANNGKPPFVEIRKLQQRFRSFLSAEEAFWSTFIRRVVRTYGLNEAKPALVALNILRPEPTTRTTNIPKDHPLAPSSPTPSQSQDESQPISPGERSNKLQLVHKVLIYLGDLARYREQYNEAGGRPKAGQHTHSPNDRGRGKRGGRGGTGAGGRRGAADVAPRERDYSKAAECYQQARLLVPDNGNPSNQLAVLAVWSSDPFNSSYHCYRALCVRQPFPTAKENLDKSLLKALDTYKKRRSARTGNTDPVTLTENFKEDVIYLHALWFHRHRSTSLPRHSSAIIEQLKEYTSLRTLSSELVMKTLILALAALWHVRLFTRKTRGSEKNSEQPAHGKASGKKSSPTKPRQTGGKQESYPSSSEPLILSHILDICRTLMEVGIAELAVSGDLQGNGQTGEHGESGDDLAQNITAVLRRILPPLRVAFKWAKGNLEYIKSLAGNESPSTLPELRQKINSFWNTYSLLVNTLSESFPLDRLTPMTMPLEEDTELKGFSPLKNEMFHPPPSASGDSVTQIATAGVPVSNQVHPNEEQLMRISDLIADAKLTARSKNSPLILRGHVFHVKGDANPISTPRKDVEVEKEDSPVPSTPERSRDIHRPREQDQDTDRDDRNNSHSFGTDSNSVGDSPSPADDEEDDGSEILGSHHAGHHNNHDDDAATVSTRTEDDPVNLAMTATLNIEDEEEEEDEDMVLYPVMASKLNTSLPPPGSTDLLRGLASGPIGTTVRDDMSQPQQAPVPSKSYSASSALTLNHQPPNKSPPAAMTAQDLLARALAGAPTTVKHSPITSHARSPSLTNPYQSPVIHRPVMTHHSPSLSQAQGPIAVDHQAQMPAPPLLFGSASSVWAPSNDAPYPSKLGKLPLHSGYPYQMGEAIQNSLRPFSGSNSLESSFTLPPNNSVLASPPHNNAMAPGLRSPFSSVPLQVTNTNTISPLGAYGSQSIYAMGTVTNSPNLTPGRSRYPQYGQGSQSPPAPIAAPTSFAALQERRISPPNLYYDSAHHLNKGSSLHQVHMSDPFASPPPFTGAPRAWG